MIFFTVAAGTVHKELVNYCLSETDSKLLGTGVVAMSSFPSDCGKQIFHTILVQATGQEKVDAVLCLEIVPQPKKTSDGHCPSFQTRKRCSS